MIILKWLVIENTVKFSLSLQIWNGQHGQHTICTWYNISEILPVDLPHSSAAVVRIWGPDGCMYGLHCHGSRWLRTSWTCIERYPPHLLVLQEPSDHCSLCCPYHAFASPPSPVKRDWISLYERQCIHTLFETTLESMQLIIFRENNRTRKQLILICFDFDLKSSMRPRSINLTRFRGLCNVYPRLDYMVKLQTRLVWVHMRLSRYIAST